MYLKKLILIVAGEAMNGDKKDATAAPSLEELKSKRSPLSHMDRIQIEESYIKIWPHIKTMNNVDIYSSDSRSATESAFLLQKKFNSSAKRIRNFKVDEHLYSDPVNDYDVKWIKEEIETSTANAIIMVGAIDFVRWLPKDLFGKDRNDSKRGEGICIEIDTLKIEHIIFDEDYWRSKDQKEAFK